MSSQIILIRTPLAPCHPSTSLRAALAPCPYEAVISFNTEYQSPNSRIIKSSNQVQSHFFNTEYQSPNSRIIKSPNQVQSHLFNTEYQSPNSRIIKSSAVTFFTQEQKISTPAHQKISTL